MLLNLCINARDAMPDGGRLTMATQRIVLERDESDICSLLQPGSYVTFTVTDTGCGMPPEVKDRVFEPFFTTKGIGKGTGLGLAMVYGAVQQHDGTIDVTSEPGAGTSFKIMLPTAVSCEIAVDQQPMRLAAGGRETILVAEDEPIVRDLAVRILTRAGYSVLAASDGEQAWQLFEAHTDRISLALLDAVMPKLTGRQVYERISHARPELPVVFSSGYDRETGQGKSFPDKRLRTVQKPYESETLLQAVRHALDEAQLPEASPCS
jgi:CheY-like chemotaxis protein